MPLEGIVAAIRDGAVPHNKDWFAYKTSEEAPQAFLAERARRASSASPSSRRTSRSPRAPSRAISVAFRLVLDAGDEAIYSEPAWFCYEPMLLAADAVPRKVPLKQPRFDLDLDAIDAAIGPRTRLVIVNTPHNPTGRIYGREALAALADLLERASERIGRRIFLLSDEPYRRLRFDGRGFVSPAAVYPVDADLVQLRQGAARAGPATRLSGDLAADAGGRSAGAARCDVRCPDGARLVLSERRHAVRRAAISSGCRSTFARSPAAATR